MAKAKDPLSEFFPPNHVEKAFVAVSETAQFIAALVEKDAREYGCKVSLRVDRRLLHMTIVSAYYDIARYKHFHFSGNPSKRSDGVKRAAYLTKWIVRRRPIQFHFEDQLADASEIEEAWVLTANEHLAVEWGIHCVAHDFCDVGIDLVTKFRKELVYELHYRDLNADALLSIYQMLSDVVRHGAENPFLEIPTA